ncbi:protein of unknown function [Paraburkholderia kururiensis]
MHACSCHVAARERLHRRPRLQTANSQRARPVARRAARGVCYVCGLGGFSNIANLADTRPAARRRRASPFVAHHGFGP